MHMEHTIFFNILKFYVVDYKIIYFSVQIQQNKFTNSTNTRTDVRIYVCIYIK